MNFWKSFRMAKNFRDLMIFFGFLSFISFVANSFCVVQYVKWDSPTANRQMLQKRERDASTWTIRERLQGYTKCEMFHSYLRFNARLIEWRNYGIIIIFCKLLSRTRNRRDHFLIHKNKKQHLRDEHRLTNVQYCNKKRKKIMIWKKCSIS